MSQLLNGFLLGNSTILTNVCILPLYPGLIAYLAGNAESGRSQGATKWLGFLVLGGVLSLLLLVGLILYLLQKSVNNILPIMLPIIYGIVIVLGVLMLLGRNPFNRLSMAQMPALSNPYAGAFVYGLMLGPMTLPCSGPFIITAFLLGTGGVADLIGSLGYVLAYGVGFGWPLVLLPFFAIPFQRKFTRWMGQNYKLLTRISGVLLVAIGVFGLWVDVIPNL